jgi:hypothetical protein
MLKLDDKGVPIRNKDGHVEPVIEYPYATVYNSPSTLKVQMLLCCLRYLRGRLWVAETPAST